MSSGGDDQDVRVSRVAKAVRDIVANAVIRGLRDVPRGPVTVTRADVVRDFKSATIYVSIFTEDTLSEKERERKIDEILFAFEDAEEELRREINKQLRLKHIPHLEFVLDTGLEKMVRLSGILKDNKK